MPISVHQHIYCSLKRGKTSQVWGEITAGENEFSLYLAIWESCLNGAGTTHHEHLSVCGVTHLGAHPSLIYSPGMEPGWPNWWTLALIRFGELTHTHIICWVCFFHIFGISRCHFCCQGVDLRSLKASLRQWLQNCTFNDLRQPGITKLDSLEQKHLFWPGLELLLFLPAEIPLPVCGTPPGEELSAFYSRLVEALCFLPLWPRDMQGSSWDGMALFESAGRKGKGTVGKAHDEYPGRCWECIAHVSGKQGHRLLSFHMWAETPESGSTSDSEPFLFYGLRVTLWWFKWTLSSPYHLSCFLINFLSRKHCLRHTASPRCSVFNGFKCRHINSLLIINNELIAN